MTEADFLNAFGIFLIAMVRFSGFFINLPAFGEAIVPMRIKAGLAALCSLGTLPNLLRTQALPALSVPEYGLMALKELLVGLILGFVVLIFIDALKFSGELVGMQIGFSFVQVVDPESSRNQAIVAEFFQLSAVLIFLIVGGHLILLQALTDSFNVVPLSQLKLNGSVVSEISRLTAHIFWLGMQISMPVLAIILVGDVALGIIARSVPRMNIFQVGFSIKILLGLWVLILIMPTFSDIVKTLYQQVYGQVNNLMNLLH